MPGHGRIKIFNFLRLKGMRSKLRPPVQFVRLMLIPWVKARLSLKELDHLAGPAEGLARKGTVVVAAHYGNHAIADAFLDHHRRLGVVEFVFLDLSEAGGLVEHLGPDSGCAVWRPRPASAPDRVTFWLNALRARYATGRWCLSLDSGDAFVFYRCETRKLGDLTEFLESESRDHVYAVMVEMYGEKPAAEFAGLEAGQAPGGVLDHFDPMGFMTLDPGRYRNVIVRGGIQRRTLFKMRPRQSPALNRIPLVRWQWYYAYLTGTRVIMPTHLNNPHSLWHSSPTGCILRFALLNDRATLETAAKWESQAIIRDAGSACYPGLSRLRDVPLKQEVSRRYTGSRDLVDCGLLNPGQWF